MDTKKLVKNSFQVFFTNANTFIFNGYNDTFFVIPCGDRYIRFILRVFNCIIYKVWDWIQKMNFINYNQRLGCLKINIDCSITVIDLECEIIHSLINNSMNIHLNQVKLHYHPLKYSHLKNFFNLKFQPHALIGNNFRQSVNVFILIGYRFISHHLGSKRNSWNWCFELMSHIVDEIVSYFWNLFLAEDYDKCSSGENNQYQDKKQSYEPQVPDFFKLIMLLLQTI